MLVMMLLLLCKWQTSYRCRCYDVDNVVVVGDGYIVLVVGCCCYIGGRLVIDVRSSVTMLIM